MKAIIPVAGAGIKLRPHTYTQPKALIPIAGKTILSVIVDDMVKWGIRDFIFIIGYLGDKIKEYVLETYPELNCTFIEQHQRLGTGHAILLAKEAVGDDEVSIVYGDTISSFDVKEILESPYSMIGIKRVDDPRLFGVAELDKEHFLVKAFEKPKIPKSNLAIVGVYKIRETKLMFECLEEYLVAGTALDGEYQFTRALQLMIDRGAKLKAFEVKNWFDCGKKDNLLETNATLLRRLEKENPSEIPEFKNTVVIPPVHIGKNCIIENAIIGPNVTLGDNVTIDQSIITNTIIGTFAELHNIVLKNSLIGSDVLVNGLSQSLSLGDNTVVDLG